MWVGAGADTLSMVLFPPEFPFVRRAADPLNDAPSAEPIIESVTSEPQASETVAESTSYEVTELTTDEAIERSRLMMFPAEFPFVRRASEAPAVVPQANQVAAPEIAAPIIETIATQPIASIPEPTPV